MPKAIESAATSGLQPGAPDRPPQPALFLRGSPAQDRRAEPALVAQRAYLGWKERAARAHAHRGPRPRTGPVVRRKCNQPLERLEEAFASAVRLRQRLGHAGAPLGDGGRVRGPPAKTRLAHRESEQRLFHARHDGAHRAMIAASV